MKCNGDNILVVMDGKIKTESGLIISNDMPNTGVIYCDCEYKDLKAGTHVVIKPTAGINISLRGKLVRQCTSKELVAILDDKDVEELGVAVLSELSNEDDLK